MENSRKGILDRGKARTESPHGKRAWHSVERNSTWYDWRSISKEESRMIPSVFSDYPRLKYEENEAQRVTVYAYRGDK